jgi:hypothetical protein
MLSFLTATHFAIGTAAQDEGSKGVEERSQQGERENAGGKLATTTNHATRRGGAARRGRNGRGVAHKNLRQTANLDCAVLFPGGQDTAVVQT